MIYTTLYLASIVAANLLVAQFGPSITIINAFLFIGLDLTCRDKLHDAWQHSGLWWRMLALIAAGSLLSWWMNHDAGRIALASFLAFLSAGIVDTIVYHLLRKTSVLTRINGSNVFSATTDSVIFTAVAFGTLLPVVVAGQIFAKVVGGLVWSIALSLNHKNATI